MDRRTPLLAAALLAASALLPAQGEPSGVRHGRGERARRAEAAPADGPRRQGPRRQRRMLSASADEVEAGDPASSAVTGSPVVTPLASTSPRRIAPGASARLEVVLALRSEAVLLPAARFDVTYESQQGPIALGAWTRQPPQLGTIHPRFRGIPVFDNTAQLSVPVTVAAGTPFGRYTVQLQVRAQLHDGETGEPLQDYRAAVPCAVEVGAALPTPVVAPRPLDETARGGTPAADPPEAPAERAAEQPRPEPPPGPSARFADPPSPGAADPSPTEGTPPVLGEDGPDPLMWGLLGALAAGLAALVWRHRHR